MNAISCLIVSTILLVSYGHLDFGNASVTDRIPLAETFNQNYPFFNKEYLSKSDAEKILGEKAFLSDSSSTAKKDTLEIKKAYTSNSKDKKTGVIYFMIEEYSQVASAKDAYHNIKVANEHHKGIKVLHDVGDEAYFHSDRKNFYFILVRKQNMMFRIKVNKLTSTTSLEEFNLISRKIANNL